MLELQPITLKEAYRFIEQHHRHHQPPQGARFAIAINDGREVVGIVVVGRPVARNRDDGWTAEVTRLCTNGTRNACSKLYAAAWRAARAMGYKRIGTYILKDEPGTSLKAAGWKCLGEVSGGTWNRKNRPRVDTHPIGQKTLWEQDSQ